LGSTSSRILSASVFSERISSVFENFLSSLLLINERNREKYFQNIYERKRNTTSVNIIANALGGGCWTKTVFVATSFSVLLVIVFCSCDLFLIAIHSDISFADSANIPLSFLPMASFAIFIQPIILSNQGYDSLPEVISNAKFMFLMADSLFHNRKSFTQSLMLESNRL
jgi:hypothetical protein